MNRARTKWYLVDNQDGTFDVLKRGRPVLVSVTRQKATHYLRSKAGENSSVYETEPDGYQTRMKRVE